MNRTETILPLQLNLAAASAMPVRGSNTMMAGCGSRTFVVWTFFDIHECLLAWNVIVILNIAVTYLSVLLFALQHESVC